MVKPWMMKRGMVGCCAVVNVYSCFIGIRWRGVTP
jgi:hypothetical protein